MSFLIFVQRTFDWGGGYGLGWVEKCWDWGSFAAQVSM